jgi:hypothetical protein
MSHLLLMTPEADTLVAELRADHDWTAAHGIGAHVTVRTPFFGVAAARERDIERTLGSCRASRIGAARWSSSPSPTSGSGR